MSLPILFEGTSARIGEMSKHVTVGFVGSMSDLFVEHGVPLLRGQNIEPYRLNLENLKYIDLDTHKKWKKSALEEGDVAIVRVGYPGTAAVIPPGMGALNAASLVIVRPDPDRLSARYLAYVLNSPWGKATVSGLLVGSAQQVLNTKTVSSLEIPAPPLETQRRIVSILGAYDDLIEVNRRRIAVLEEMARGLFEEWFVRFRFPGHEAVPILDTQDGPLPEGWSWGAFGDLAREVRHTVSPDDVPPDTPYVGLEHMPRRSFTLDQHGQAEEVSSLKSHFQRGDILFGKIRPYFHKVIWAGFDGVSSTDAIVWRPVAELAAQALATASSDAFVAYSVQTSNGTKMPRANTRVLADYRCALAPSDYSRRFEETVGPMVELCATLQAWSRRLAASRDLLLPRLISGQLSVADAERQMVAA